MLKKIIALTIACLAVLVLTISGTWAFLSDTEKASQNPIKAARLNLLTGTSPDGGTTINYSSGLTQSFNTLKLKPGESTPPVTIYLKNEAGNLNGSTLDVNFQYAQVIGDQNGTYTMSAESTATVLEVTILEYNRTQNFLTDGTITDWNGNGYIDMQDLQVATSSLHHQLNGLVGIQAGFSKPFVIQLKMRSRSQMAIIDSFQGDGLDITMKFTLNQ